MDSRRLLLLSFSFSLLCCFVLSDFCFGLIQLRRFGLIEIKTETKLEVNLNDVRGIFESLNLILFDN